VRYWYKRYTIISSLSSVLAFCQQIDKYHIMLENCQRTEKIVNVPVTVPLVFISVRCNGDYVVVDDSEAGTLPTGI
jgi:hypothetical protein